MTRQRPAVGVVLCCVVLMLVSCTTPPSPPASGGTEGALAGASAPSPKVLRLVVHASAEPVEGIMLLGASGAVGTESLMTFHAGLTVYDPDLNLTPRLADQVPTIENGGWQLFPDGTMEVTWRLRTDATWHDGTPLTAEDFVLGYTVRSDRELPISAAFPTSLVSAVAASDAYTFVVRWRQPYILANASAVIDFPALPRHLLQSLYEQGDKQAFISSAYWTREFVGLGPYRIGNWQLGSSLEGVAFDRYFLGRPKIDRVIYQYIGDPNAEVASLLAGHSDMAPVGSSLALEHMVIVKNAWEPAGQGTTMPIPRGVRFMHLQHRDPAAPWVRDPAVRRALVHAIDRQALVDSIQYGLTTVADTLVSQDDPVYAIVQERGLTRYPYDAARSRQLLGAAGWSPGPDGIMQRAGQRFTFSVSAQGRSYFPKEAEAIAGQLTEVGVATSPITLTAGATNLNEMTANIQGGLTWPSSFGPTWAEALTSRRIPTAENRWTGANFGGYTNPTLDQLYERYQVTLPAAERISVLADVYRIAADDVAVIPLYHMMQTVMFRTGIRGPGRIPAIGNQLASAWNMHTWEID